MALEAYLVLTAHSPACSSTSPSYVTHEVIDDDGGETPSEGSSSAESFYDADGDAHAQHREERFVDYYRVRRGRPTSEGRHLRRGVHVVSHDKDARKLPITPSNRSVCALEILLYTCNSRKKDHSPAQALICPGSLTRSATTPATTATPPTRITTSRPGPTPDPGSEIKQKKK